MVGLCVFESGCIREGCGIYPLVVYLLHAVAESHRLCMSSGCLRNRTIGQ